MITAIVPEQPAARARTGLARGGPRLWALAAYVLGLGTWGVGGSVALANAVVTAWTETELVWVILAFVLGRRALINGSTWLRFGIALAVVRWSKRTVPGPVLIPAAGIAGVTLQQVPR